MINQLKNKIEEDLRIWKSDKPTIKVIVKKKQRVGMSSMAIKIQYNDK